MTSQIVNLFESYFARYNLDCNHRKYLFYHSVIPHPVF